MTSPMTRRPLLLAALALPAALALRHPALAQTVDPVSYTHLTLPTIRLV